MYKTYIFSAELSLELTYGFDKWRTLNISDHTSYFYNTDVCSFTMFEYLILDLIGDVWDDLHSFPEEISFPFFLDH